MAEFFTTTRRIVEFSKTRNSRQQHWLKTSTRWRPNFYTNRLLYLAFVNREIKRPRAQQPSTRVSEQVRAILMRASSAPKADIYSLSNEGFGPPRSPRRFLKT